MRTRVQLLLAILVLTSCATTVQPTGQSAADRIRSLYDAFAQGDVPTVLGSFDPEIVWMEAENINYADRNPYRGPQAVAEVFSDPDKMVREDLENFKRLVEGSVIQR